MASSSNDGFRYEYERPRCRSPLFFSLFSVADVSVDTTLGIYCPQGFAVGLVSLGISLRLGLILILFYKSSSILTKVGFDKKSQLTDDYKARRNRFIDACMASLKLSELQ